MPPIRSISPREYAALRRSANPPLLIDVREPWEYAIAHVEGVALLPLDQIYDWGPALDPNVAYVLICHHGIRSAIACQVLLGLGLSDVTNLEGGIDAWADQIEPAMARY